MHAKRLSKPMPRRAGCPTQRSSRHCRLAKRPRCLMSPLMSWALRRTPSGLLLPASQPTTLRKLGSRNASGSGGASLPLSANSFLTINNAGAPSAGTPLTTDEPEGPRAAPPTRRAEESFKICCRCMTCRGTNSATVSPTISTDRLLRFRHDPPSPLSTSTRGQQHWAHRVAAAQHRAPSTRPHIRDGLLAHIVASSLALEAGALSVGRSASTGRGKDQPGAN